VTINKLITGHFNTAFVQAPPVGSNYGASTAASFVEFLPMLKAAGVSPQGWIESMYRVNGVVFTSTVEQASQGAWARDLLAAYPNLDGVHLDYIRYDSWEAFGINGKADGISATVKSIRDNTTKKLSAATLSVNPNYINFSTEKIPDWYRRWFATNPNGIYSSPLYALGPQFFKYQQDPISWPLDGIIPMEYSKTDTAFSNEIDAWISFLEFTGQSKNKLYPGIDWNGKDDQAQLLSKIRLTRSKGLRGFVVFQIGKWDANDAVLIKLLATEFNNTLLSCLR
jgi:hypothetical protein